MSEARSDSIDAIVITGPTGSGKTALALELGRRLPVEVISVDSAMVYRGLDIGSGKPSRDELASVPHHLVDILDPSEAYSAGRFVSDVRSLLPQIRRRGNVPLLVGGTMLYLRALSRGLAPLPQADPAVRAALDARAAILGWPALHDELAKIDPQTAERIRPRDAQRIQRALEVHQLTGVPLSTLQARSAADNSTVRLKQFVWGPGDRGVLYERIARRFEAMLAAGLLDEVGRLHARRDLSPALPALRCVGYRQLWAYFTGSAPLDTAVTEAVKATRHLARRQLTWLRSEAELEWCDSLELQAVDQMFARVENWVACCVST